MYNRLLGSIFEGYKEATKDKRKKQSFDLLDSTPFLHSSEYLGGLFDMAEDKEDYETILDHLYRHEATEVDSYASIEQKIIDKYWR